MRAHPGAITIIAGFMIHLVMLTTGIVLPASDAEAQTAPAAGTFLVASRDLRDSGFAESIILIIQHNQNEAEIYKKVEKSPP